MLLAILIIIIIGVHAGALKIILFVMALLGILQPQRMCYSENERSEATMYPETTLSEVL